MKNIESDDGDGVNTKSGLKNVCPSERSEPLVNTIARHKFLKTIHKRRHAILRPAIQRTKQWQKASCLCEGFQIKLKYCLRLKLLPYKTR